MSGKTNIIKRKMQELVINTADKSSVKASTESIVKILVSAYKREDTEKVAPSATQLNPEVGKNSGVTK